MATRSRIGIRNEDASVDSIYCHWDGYPEHNGLILVRDYQDESKIRQLISMGSLSSLGPEIGEQHPDINPYPFASTKYQEWAERFGRMCTFHRRDMRRGRLEIAHSNTVQEFLDIRWGEEYHYIFHYGRWLVRKHYDDQPRWRLVEEVIRETNEHG